MLDKQRAENFKNQMIAAAFIGWQTNVRDKTFNEYLALMGLSEKKHKMSKECKDSLVKQITANTKRILDLDRRAPAK